MFIIYCGKVNAKFIWRHIPQFWYVSSYLSGIWDGLDLLMEIPDD
ncbi:MAG: hypothetical protein AAF388_14195 [Bacteroidota bacterium]